MESVGPDGGDQAAVTSPCLSMDALARATQLTRRFARLHLFRTRLSFFGYGQQSTSSLSPQVSPRSLLSSLPLSSAELLCYFLPASTDLNYVLVVLQDPGQ